MDWWTKRPDNEARSIRGRYSRPSVSEITDDLLVGEYPRLGDLDWLKDEYRISAIHNLQDDIDLHINGLDELELRDECSRLGLTFVRTPIHDGSADDMAARLVHALDALGNLIEDEQRVFLHCNGGLNRAPTVAIGWLHAQRRYVPRRSDVLLQAAPAVRSLHDGARRVISGRAIRSPHAKPDGVTEGGVAGEVPRAVCCAQIRCEKVLLRVLRLAHSPLYGLRRDHRPARAALYRT